MLVALLLAVLAGVTVGCSPGGDSSAADGQTPSTSATAEETQLTQSTVVLEQDFPDPDVLRVGDTYYAYATQASDNSSNVQMATSPDLQTWQAETTDPFPDLPAWATNGRTWAPDVAAVPDGYVMYFTAHSIDPDRQCIGVARSGSPEGPFQPVGAHPLVCPAARGGAIDAASFTDEDGSRYLLWKNDGNCCGKDTWLHLQPLSADGLRLTGPPVRLVKQTETWEGDLVEAPTLVHLDGTYVLLYSANDYGGDLYTTGYATATGLRGPYRKGLQPLLTTEKMGVIGPGGQDVVTGPDGERHIVFHGWDEAHVARHMHVTVLEWTGSGADVVPEVTRPSGAGGS